jgi:hypothetical protein
VPQRARSGGPWYGQFSKRFRFERGARERLPDLRSSPSRNPQRRGWIYRFNLPVDGYETRRVTILFQSPGGRIPVVNVDGRSSPHRYTDGSLCMWFPNDPPERRWVFDDGLLMLITQIAVHLFKEAWWRETGGDSTTGAVGEWLGDEAPHGGPNDPTMAEQRKAA